MPGVFCGPGDQYKVDSWITGVSGLHWHPFPPRTLRAKPSKVLDSQNRCSQFTVPRRSRVMAWCCSWPLTEDHSYWPTWCSQPPPCNPAYPPLWQLVPRCLTQATAEPRAKKDAKSDRKHSLVQPSKVGWRTTAMTKRHLKYPYHQGALMFQNRTSAKKKSPFAQPLPSPATLLLLQSIASTSFLQLVW